MDELPALPDLTDLTFRGFLAGFFAGSGSDRSIAAEEDDGFDGADDDLFCLPMVAVLLEVLRDVYGYMYDTGCRLGFFRDRQVKPVEMNVDNGCLRRSSIHQ